MKNCWPLANSFAPLTEIVGMAVMVEARKLNVRRTGVNIDSMPTSQMLIVWKPGDKSCAESSAIGVRATEDNGQTRVNRLRA